ncbi:MAG: cysteine hydrolase [Chloroflexi bacterium]|nr:cysteine hydrolase [Chloroflexota bacterium]
MEQSVQIIDRSAALDALKRQLTLDPRRTALVTVDLHRGHLDPDVATMPVPVEHARRVVQSAACLVRLARSLSIPVIHVILQNRRLPGGAAEQLHNPFWRAVEAAGVSLTPAGASTVERHNLPGSRGTELMPELGPEPGDYVIDTKRRLSAFHGTDLEITLRSLEVETILLIGVNTNTCVQCTAFDAFNRDFGVVVVADCVHSMYGDDLHLFGLQNIARAFGWVLSLDEVAEKLGTTMDGHQHRPEEDPASAGRPPG